MLSFLIFLLALDDSDIRIMKTYVSILFCSHSLAYIFLGSRSLCAETQGRRQGYQRHTKTH